MHNRIEILHASLFALVPLALLYALWWTIAGRMPPFLTGLVLCYLVSHASRRLGCRQATIEILDLQASYDLPDYDREDR